MRVLVSSAGAGPGIAVVKALTRRRTAGDFVLAVDMSRRAAGLYLADAWRLVPAADDAGFLDAVIGHGRAFGIEMVIPILDLETPVFAGGRDRLGAAGLRLAANSLACILASNDKRRSHDVCAKAGIPQPRRFDSPAAAGPGDYPIIGRPVDGIGSKGVIRLDEPDERVVRNLDREKYIWQAFVAGQEYSIDTYGHPDRGPFVAVPRLRRVVKAGQMVQGETVQDARLTAFAADVCRAFDVTDVACIQVIRAPDGGLHFVEINPRYGTGVSLSIEAGIDFPRLQWLGLTDPAAIRPGMLEYRGGLEVLRYWEEVYL